MSGLLRRIKRSRTTDAGGNSAEGRAAGPEGAPTAETSAVDTSSAETTELQIAAGTSEPAAPDVAPDPQIAAGTSEAAAAPGIPAAVDPSHAAAPVAEPVKDIPAGLDPAQAGAQAATGRRSRLRRRLRYLRRARELMLRDLGGLLYEVHRTGGGDVAAHAATIGAKVERLAGLEGEAAAIETALAAPRSQTVVFEPGIGGTCDVCGELYGSAARFCSHCGSPAGAAAPPVEPRPLPAMPRAPASGAATDESGPGEHAPPVAPAATDESAPGKHASRTEPASAADESQQAEDAAPALPAAAGEQSTADVVDPLVNGRADDGTAPGLAPGDPLAAKESRT